jgi:HK97 family phage major capsid protein
MSDVLNRGALFPEELIPGLINIVKGESALAKLSGSAPISFNGQREFTFAFDKEVDIVAESAAKTKGGVTIAPVTILPVKVEYGARVSDEFLYGSDEYQLDILSAFAEGFAKKSARGFDIAAFHGLNPRTATASSVVGGNHFDGKVTQTVTKTANPDTDIESAIAVLEALENDVTGIAMTPAFRSALAALKDDVGRKIYPEIAWGQKLGVLNGLPCAANSTLAFNSSPDNAIVGDFANAFKWGYAKEIPTEVIQYGNPDNDATLGDLKGHNQVYIRAELYIGWGILLPGSFARIINAS